MGTADYFGQILRGPLGLAMAGVWGALWGSFFNVMIVRLPAGMSLVTPPSRCFSCQSPVRWFDNIPLLSYVLLRGRCRHCGARFSARYFFVELLVAGLTMAMHQRFFVEEPQLAVAATRFFITAFFCGLCVVISFIDLDTMRIPNAITYPGIPAFAALSLSMGHAHLWDGPLGAVAGYLVIRLLADGWKLATGRQGMGYGDAKLLAMIGGLLGWQMLMPTLFLASLQGSVLGIGALLLFRAWGSRDGADATLEGESAEHEQVLPSTEVDESEPVAAPASLRTARIPFGPFLCMAALELLFLWPRLPQLLPWL